MPKSPRKPRKRAQKRLPNDSAIIAATVRPQDVAVRRWSKRGEVENLLRRYAKWVKVAVTMRATGLAQLPLRFYREGAGAGEKSMRWRGRMVKDRVRTKMGTHTGPGTSKSMGYIDDLEEVTDPGHPCNALFDRVNPWTSGFRFIEAIEASACMTGNSYAGMVIPPGLGYPTELWQLPPQSVRIIPSRTDFIEGYMYGRGTEVEKFYKPDEMLAFKRSSPKGDPWYGEGDMESCVPDADLSFAMSQVALALLDNGIMPGLVFCGEDWTAEQRSEARAEFEREHQGVAKIGRSLFISGKVKLDKVQIGQYEVELLQGSDDHAREVVAACFGVPLEYMTLRPGGLGDGKGVAGNQFQLLTLLPTKQRLEDDLNLFLMPHFRTGLNDDSLVCCIDSPVVEDVEATERRAVALFTGNLAYRDEARSMVGLDPVDADQQIWAAGLAAPVMATGMQIEAGKPAMPGETEGEEPEPTARPLTPEDRAEVDKYILAVVAGESPADYVRAMLGKMGLPPADVEAFVAPAEKQRDEKKAEADAKAEQDRQDAMERLKAPGSVLASGAGSSPKPDDGGDPPESGKSLERSVTGEAVTAATGSLSAYLCQCGKPHAEQKDDDDWARRVAAFNRAMDEFFVAYNSQTQNAAMAAIRVGEAAGFEFSSAPLLYADPQAFRDMADAVTRASMKPMMEGQHAALSAVIRDGHGEGVDMWQEVPSAAQDMLRARAEKVAESALRNYDEAVRKRIIAELGDVTEGVTREKLAAAVARAVPDVSAWKADQIAQTETVRSYNAGLKATYDDIDAIVGYRWVAAGLERRCDFCDEMDGKTTGKGKPFLLLGEPLEVDGETLENDFEEVEYPPVHPFCRCVILPVYREGA